ncbi:phage holin family protein [Paenibacillus methanolicus]|uniref:Toxin secretion/phage lysis holin n=1 Tax=Paenibacillus methanolicus TaxID=582686 RepID=A0A5S5C7G5_9BACL|nr:toxin secretion/phage lysis holin [Paenibacillus methanolicus]
MVQWVFCTIVAGLGAVEAFVFGIWQESLTVLLVAMGIDIISGIAAAVKRKTGLNSQIGSWGLTRKGLMFLVILLAHRIDVLLGTGYVTMNAAIYFYLANELISIIENFGVLGIPLPPKLRELIEVLKNKK